MIAWLLKFLASRAFAWIMAGGIVAGSIAYIETLKSRAYDRGVADTKTAMQKVLEKKAAENREDKNEIRVLPDKEIDCELLEMRGEKC
jgi:hypothetical protein